MDDYCNNFDMLLGYELGWALSPEFLCVATLVYPASGPGPEELEPWTVSHERGGGRGPGGGGGGQGMPSHELRPEAEARSGHGSPW